MTKKKIDFEFPEDMNTWSPLHWLVQIILTSGPVSLERALRISAVLLENPNFIMSALEEAGVLESLPASA